MSWDGWPLDRAALIFVAVAFAGLWAQVTLLHWRGGFRNIFMWGPVIYTPLIVIAAAAAAATPVMRSVCLWVCVLGALEGLLGLYKHLHGVKEHVGGFTLRNFAVGPPVLLPFLYAGLAGFGALVAAWPQLTGGRL